VTIINANLVKYGLVLLLPSIILFLLGLYANQKIPDEIELGKIIIEKINETSPYNPQAQQIYKNTVLALDILQWGTLVVGIIFIILGLFVKNSHNVY